MDACEGRDKQPDNDSDRKRQQDPDFSIDCRIYKKKIKLNEKDQRLLNAKVKQNGAPSSTMLHDLPFEMLDVILQKSYLQWILNSSTKQRDDKVISSLISVDVCFNETITRRRFKKAIWHYLKDFYGETKKRHAIIRNNRNYLAKNIQPNDELIASLLSVNCITEEQSHFIQRHRSTRDKNYELLHVIGLFDETKFSHFVNCLRRINQRTVAKIIENGGGVIKIQVQTRDAKCTASMETKINDLRDRTKSRSHKTDKFIAQLRDEDIDILNAQLDRQTVVVWIWCRSQTAIENLQRLYASNQLRDKYFEHIQPSTSKVINIDRNQFKKIVVVRSITINVTQRIQMPEHEETWGVTKLRDKIYVGLHFHIRPISLPGRRESLIRVFEDRYPFHPETDIKTEEIDDPNDIESSEKENCIYVSEYDEQNCVWKITRETDDQHKIIKWLTTDYEPYSMSVSKDGELLMINKRSHCLMIYGSDAEIIRSIPLRRDIKDPRYAVETSIGNFIIIEIQENEKEEEPVVMGKRKHADCLETRQGKGVSNRRKKEWLWVVTELTRDGQMVIRRFIPPNEIQQRVDFSYLLVDSDDRVFVANPGENTVILLDSDLKRNRILCPTKEGKEEQIPIRPRKLFYDEEMKQLTVESYLSQVHVYTLSRH